VCVSSWPAGRSRCWPRDVTVVAVRMTSYRNTVKLYKRQTYFLPVVGICFPTYIPVLCSLCSYLPYSTRVSVDLLSVNNISRRCDSKFIIILRRFEMNSLLASVSDTVIRDSINSFSIQYCMRVSHPN
jgi:hypothetical protein